MTERPAFTYVFAKDHGLVPLGGEEDGAELVGARGTPRAASLIEARRVLGRPLRIERLPPEIFERRLSEVYSADALPSSQLAEDLETEQDLFSLADDMPKSADLLESQGDAPIIRVINALIAEAIKTKASDIHIEPYEQRLSVRFRIDGVLREILSLSNRLAPLLVSRIKVMARLDIAEKRVPQDGRISISIGEKTIDVRVSTLPSGYGERVVMRLLDKDNAGLGLDQLGMPEQVLIGFKSALVRPNGIILVTGPTGSGKTTTLYAGLNLLNEQTRSILTIEDPIEYALEGVGQTQVNARVGMTFAAGLRAILRQDPDVVMVGEVRDVETAQTAVQASLTGHLVLSTVHTNSAVGAVTRLRDMGVEPFLLSATVTAILAQRLVRRLCPHCKEPYAPTASELEAIGAAGDFELTLYRPKGCGRCNQTGYEGRIGVYELILMDETLRGLIHDAADERRLKDYAFRKFETLQQNGFRHVRAGVTSIEEVLRVAREDEGDGGV